MAQIESKLSSDQPSDYSSANLHLSLSIQTIESMNAELQAAVDCLPHRLRVIGKVNEPPPSSSQHLQAAGSPQASAIN